MFVWPAPRRKIEVVIGVPASTLSVEPSLQLKTVKAGFIGRAAAVFRVSKVAIYADRAEAWVDLETFRKILEYLVTAPYLRKRVFPPSMPELRYVGVLPPLQIPTHGVEGPKEGEVREALVTRKRGRSVVVEAGLEQPVEVEYSGRPLKRGDRLYVRIVKLEPPELEIVEEPDVYTGFSVATYDSLRSLISGFKGKAVILATSKKGKPFEEIRDELVKKLSELKRILVLFGSPKEGLYEIAEREGFELDKEVDFVVNTVELQGTLTVRTEEAVWITLARLNPILNAIEEQVKESSGDSR